MDTGSISSPERRNQGTASQRLKTACVIQLLVLLAAWLPAVAHAQFLHTTNNGTITITGYTGPNTVVIVPDTINGLPVTSIGVQAFNGWGSRLTKITLPAGLTSIGTEAFYNCHNLTNISLSSSLISIEKYAFRDCASLSSIALPNSLAFIGDGAFWDCGRLNSISIPDGVTNIGTYAFLECGLTNVSISRSVFTMGSSPFGKCSLLRAIAVDVENPVFRSVDGVLIDSMQSRLIQYPTGRSGNYLVPDNIKSIDSFAFSYCVDLTGVTIPSGGVTNIGGSAFYNCSGLASVVIGDNLATIGDYAFYRCVSLTNITIPGTVSSIGNSAFRSCVNLANLNIENGVTRIGGAAFSECSHLKEVRFRAV